MTNATTYRNPVFFLGMPYKDGPIAYTAYTNLGLFTSAEAAAKRCLERRATIFRYFECWRAAARWLPRRRSG